MKTLIFATNNQNKIKEIAPVLEGAFKLVTLQQAGIDIEIPEPFDTLEKNARHKATVIHDLTGTNCFSEDTGLEVQALNGEPGVHSARYSGEHRDFDANIDKLLLNLTGVGDRTATFRTVIHLILDNKQYTFGGSCKGTIIAYRKGSQGFGYDPVFIPEGSEKTFAEMTLNEKQVFSHRTKAVKQLIHFLKNN